MKLLRGTEWVALLLLISAVCPKTASARHTTPPIWESSFGSSLGLSDDSTTSVALGFTFAFQGTNYTSTFVSSNGFLALGSNPGSGCCDGNVAGLLSGPDQIAPAWFDIRPPTVWYNTFSNRAVVTWAAPEFSGTVVNIFQVQLLSSGQIIFGYDHFGATDGHRHHAVVGISPGGGAADPGELNFSSSLPFNSSTVGSIYEFFARGPNSATGFNPDPFDLSGGNIIFTPNGSGGWVVTSSSTVVPEPSSLVLLGIGAIGLFGYGWRRKRKTTTEQAV